MKKRRTTKWKKAAILGFWLLIWQLTAHLVHNRILLSGPIEVVQTLWYQAADSEFYLTAACSFFRIAAGFLLAFFSALILGGLSWHHPFLGEFLEPAVFVLKSVPVASFVVLFLIWFGSEKLSSMISFLVVFPIIYYSVTAGLSQTDPQLLEMAEVFHMPAVRKLWYLYRPALWPSLLAGCRSSLGMAWKSGAAAEVIGTPSHSIGEKLYMAKITLGTADLLAWTLVLILISFAFEKLVLALLAMLGKERCKPGKISGKVSISPYKSSSLFRTASDTLAAENVEKSFGDNHIANHLSFRLAPGAALGLSAPSGAGKTTLLRMIMGLETADSGKLGLLNNDGRNLLRCTAVFQENRLCPALSAVENVRLVCQNAITAEQIRQELLRLLPPASIDLPVRELSGGMQRRVSLVRAMLPDGNLVILDEPFSGLDEENKQLAIRYIRERLDGRSLILATHQREDFSLLNMDLLLIRTENGIWQTTSLNH